MAPPGLAVKSAGSSALGSTSSGENTCRSAIMSTITYSEQRASLRRAKTRSYLTLNIKMLVVIQELKESLKFQKQTILKTRHKNTVSLLHKKMHLAEYLIAH